jgi:predicted PurR-regulated permease PerM
LLGFDNRAARYTWTAVCVVLLVGLVYVIRQTLAIFIIALLFAYLLWPLVKFIDRRLPDRPRVVALAIVYVALVGLLLIVGMTIGSRVVQEADALAARMPGLLTQYQAPADTPAAAAAPFSKSAILARVQKQLAIHSKDLLSLLSSVALGIIKRAGNLLFIILVPILSFFFLKDGREIRDSVFGFFAEGTRRDTVERIAADIHVLLAQYMRALVLLGIVAFVAYAVFFTVLGVPYGILLAAVDFPLEFIPMVGPFTGAGIVMLVAGISGSHHLLAIFIFLAAFRLFQDYVVSPHLLSSGMKLHPLLVIFGVLSGGAIAGVAGSFLSVPVLATLRIVYRNLLAKTSPEPIVAPE